MSADMALPPGPPRKTSRVSRSDAREKADWESSRPGLTSPFFREMDSELPSMIKSRCQGSVRGSREAAAYRRLGAKGSAGKSSSRIMLQVVESVWRLPCPGLEYVFADR